MPSPVRVLALVLCALELQAAPASITIDPSAGRHPISPLTYGSNNNDIAFAPFRRQGGNRMTGYNWENNASHAGSDWKHVSDFWLLTQNQKPLPGDGRQAAGALVAEQAASIRAGGAEPIITLQMAGYVAADGDGTSVPPSQKAPSRRWQPVFFRKPGAPASLAYPPDLNDKAVYMDEFVHYLVSRFKATPQGKIKYYSLDNEPDLWSDGKGGRTHPRIHPAQPGYAEILKRSAELSRMVLDLDPEAQIFAPVNYGWQGFKTLQDAPDAANYNARYGWFVSYYLDQMRLASLKARRRLLHYYDLHYYTEAMGPGGRLNNEPTATSQADSIARAHATRSLWDPGYVEQSWITKDSLREGDKAIRLIPRVKESINRHYPGTKLAFTEWSFGGEDHISGGLAAADALGIFGREDVAANAWNQKNHDYAAAAFKLYLDMDGKGGRFGDVSIQALSSDTANLPAYAAQDSRDPSRITVVAINRSYDQDLPVSFGLAQGQSVKAIRAFRLDKGGPVIKEAKGARAAKGGFSDTLPGMSATLYELKVAP